MRRLFAKTKVFDSVDWEFIAKKVRNVSQDQN